MSASSIDDFSSITGDGDFSQLDKVVARGLTAHTDVGQALAEMENHNLHREQYPKTI